MRRPAIFISRRALQVFELDLTKDELRDQIGTYKKYRLPASIPLDNGGG